MIGLAKSPGDGPGVWLFACVSPWSPGAQGIGFSLLSHHLSSRSLQRLPVLIPGVSLLIRLTSGPDSPLWVPCKDSVIVCVCSAGRGTQEPSRHTRS